ncbi:MAG: T9SS type A sorting domain-containing protein [Saprospiraceae bacterium]
MKSLLLFAISFLCFSPLCLAQTVWPGDVNNNGIVNEIDLLYLGYAFNKTGLPRAEISAEWVAQNIIEEWEGTFPDGLNFAYADCNGDGVVDEMDADVIEANLDTTHTDVPFIPDEILLPTSDLGTNFSLDDSNLLVAEGQRTIELQVKLDNTAEDLADIKVLGFAFTVDVDTQFFETEETEFNELAFWINDGGESTNRFFSNPTEGKFTIAYIKTDKKGIENPNGAIGNFSFVIIEDIIDLLEKDDTVKITIDSITVITDDLEKIPIAGSSVELEIEGRKTSTSTYNPILDEIKFYPNPTNGWLLLKSKEVFIERVELVNTLGQVVYQKQLNNTTFQSLDLQHIPEGMYWLRMITELGIKSTPIQRL